MKGSEAQVFIVFSISYGGDEASLNTISSLFTCTAAKQFSMDGVLMKLPQFTGKG